MENGYIYIMKNIRVTGVTKMGYTIDVEGTRKQLSAGIDDYEVYAVYETAGDIDVCKLQKLIDNLNPDLVFSDDTYSIAPQEGYELLEAFAHISGTQHRLRLFGKDERGEC